MPIITFYKVAQKTGKLSDVSHRRAAMLLAVMLQNADAFSVPSAVRWLQICNKSSLKIPLHCIVSAHFCEICGTFMTMSNQKPIFAPPYTVICLSVIRKPTAGLDNKLATVTVLSLITPT